MSAITDVMYRPARRLVPSFRDRRRQVHLTYNSLVLYRIYLMSSETDKVIRRIAAAASDETNHIMCPGDMTPVRCPVGKWSSGVRRR